MVHESCIHLPRVIKLTRHPHRLILTPYLPPATVLCRGCYKAVDIRYGQYTCNHADCFYVIHSKCATHPEVWDGSDVEWEPEEPGEIEVANLFRKVDDDIIQYFGHQHYLQLSEYNGDVQGAEMHCEACILPIRSERFYSCMECDYYLHQVCVSPPLRLDHLLHKHRLVLDPNHQGDSDCSTCYRKSSGFLYKCVETCCKTRMCRIDLRCISLPHFFTHKSHIHPLFTSVSYGLEAEVLCVICGNGCERAVVLCTVCKYVMCFQCATIPTELYYKYDKHPLSLCYGESADVGIYWCEVCEKQINSRKWFYTCDECCITIHHECIFGPSIYMKPGSTFYKGDRLVRVISNSSSANRWLCFMCRSRCIGSVCFTLLHEDKWIDKVCCSFSCLNRAIL